MMYGYENDFRIKSLSLFQYLKLVKSMLCLDECKAKLVSFKQCFGHEFGIKSIGIFGSVARGEQTEDSDVDVCVELQTPSMFCLVHIKDELQHLFGCAVDIVRLREDMDKLLKQNIMEEGIYA